MRGPKKLGAVEATRGGLKILGKFSKSLHPSHNCFIYYMKKQKSTKSYHKMRKRLCQNTYLYSILKQKFEMGKLNTNSFHSNIIQQHSLGVLKYEYSNGCELQMSNHKILILPSSMQSILPTCHSSTEFACRMSTPPMMFCSG